MFTKFQNSSINDHERPSLTPINLHILHNLWLPDVEILDLKAFETHSVLSKLEGSSNQRYSNKEMNVIKLGMKRVWQLYFVCFK